MSKILVTDGSSAGDGCGGSAVIYTSGKVHIHLFQYVGNKLAITSTALGVSSSTPQ